MDVTTINAEIAKIIAFRQANKGKCVSTTHDFTPNEFFGIGPMLQKRYKKLQVEFKEDRDQKIRAYITISMRGKI